jgi:hypothetical protein
MASSLWKAMRTPDSKESFRFKLAGSSIAAMAPRWMRSGPQVATCNGRRPSRQHASELSEQGPTSPAFGGARDALRVRAHTWP